jgi:hypothetical protein
VSILTDINALKFRLQNNGPLNAYFTEKFNKALSVKKVFKNRVEIGSSDLPLLMITRPQVARNFGGSKSTNKEHSILLYLGFYYDNTADLELPLDYFVEIDDLLEDAVQTKLPLAGDKSFAVTVEDSANDEGMLHPVYFMSMHLIIRAR